MTTTDEAGTVLEFGGTVDAFTKAPFTLTVLAGSEKIEGWPARRTHK